MSSDLEFVARDLYFQLLATLLRTPITEGKVLFPCLVAMSLAKWAASRQQNGGPQTVIRHLSAKHSYL